ncbi:trypsin protease, partial [Cymbomonas tetramitiformis]
FGRTLTAGVISGVNRRIPSPIGRPILGVIQTDASINSGNSGGPLLDSFGHLIGVNVATFTKLGSGRSSGVNFALPVDLVYGIVPQLIVNGRIDA